MRNDTNRSVFFNHRFTWLSMMALMVSMLASGSVEANEAVDQQLQTTLERSIPRLACNLSATHERKSPVMVVVDGKVEARELAPAKGSILGAASKANPDYFFVWMRDSSLTADALVQFFARKPGASNTAALRTFLTDYVAFTEAVQHNGSAWGVNDPRCNIDGSADLIQWSRPQRDGPALQSLALLRLYEAAASELDRTTLASLERIVTRNLDDISIHAEGKSYDPWEFVFGSHFYVRLVQLSALEEGTRLFAGSAKPEWKKAAKKLERLLDQHWDSKRDILVSSVGEVFDWRGNRVPIPGGGLDISSVLGVLHARRKTQRYSTSDAAVHSTAEALEDLFRRIYPINATDKEGPAMGRFEGDDYFGGNPWFIATLGEAELYYRRALTAQPTQKAALIAEGDAFLKRVLNVIPPNGMVGEQFDMVTGQPVSSHDLSWSYASLLTAALAREDAMNPSRPTKLKLDRIDFRCPTR